jgi:hydrogenase nickel incorporation protein HypA/HybF
MHEASLMADLMRQIDALAKREGGSRVVCVSVSIGALSHFSADHFTEHFRRAAAGTPAEGARLDISVSDDLDDPRAASVLLRSIGVED